MTSLIGRTQKEMIQMNLFTKPEKDSQTQVTNFIAGGRGVVGERENKGVGDGHVQTAIFKMKNQQGPTYSTGNSLLNVMRQPGWEGHLGENGCMYVHV